MPRYRFATFVLSSRQRALLRAGEPVALIPRYLDLLLFLIERRDSALSQSIRTLRRTLGDDPRDPRFIRTVSRHGYQEDDGALSPGAPPPGSDGGDPGLFTPLLEQLTDPTPASADHEDQRDAAERLHLLGTAEALRRREGHPRGLRTGAPSGHPSRTVHAIAQASSGAQALLTPLGQLVGEPEFGPVPRALIGMAGGGFFGVGLGFGLTRGPYSRADVRLLTQISSPAHALLETSPPVAARSRMARTCGWQRVRFVELDGPQPRQVVATLDGAG